MRSYSLLAVALAVTVLAKQPGYNDWSNADLEKWLSEHRVPNPGNLNSAQLKSLVSSYWESAPGARVTAAAASAYADATDAALRAWSDSQLREFLLEQGVVSPSGKREQLILTAKQYYKHDTASSRATSLASAASAAASNTLSSAYYAATDAPPMAYDFVAAKMDDAKDWIYSSWSDNQLKDYLVDKGVIKSDAQTKRDELLGMMQDTYDNLYEAWSDNRLRDWAVSHGIARSKTARNRDELVDLVSRNYYGARDTTYQMWSRNQLRSWLESRGLIKTGTQKKREEYLDAVSKAYYSMRDQAYSTWDDNLLRHWLESHGVMKAPSEAKRDELLAQMKDNYYSASDRVWDAWSDSEVRDYLVKNKVVAKKEAESMRRDALEKKMGEVYHSTADAIAANWKESDMRQWLIDHGFIKSDAKAKKDEVVELLSSKYDNVAGKSSEYMSWSDNRIRGWLRTNGVEVPMSSGREELIQLMRENYVTTQGLLAQLQGYIASGANMAENRMQEALAAIKGAAGSAAGQAGYEGEQGVEGAYKGAKRSMESAAASVKAEL